MPVKPLFPGKVPMTHSDRPPQSPAPPMAETAPGMSVPLDFLAALADAGSSDALYRAISVWMPRIFACDRISIALREDREKLRVVAFAGQGLVREEEYWQIEGTKLGDCLRTRAPIVINAAREQRAAYAAKSLRHGMSFESTAILPLVAAGDCIGTLNFGCYAAGAFGADTVAKMQQVAAWIAAQVSHHLAREELTASNARFDALIENAESIVFAKTGEGLILLANTRFCRAFGLARDDVIGRLEADVFGAETAAPWRESDRRVLATGLPETVEEEIAYPDGVARAHVTQKFPMFDPVRGEDIVCVIATDISEHRRVERALEESEHRFRTFFNNSASMMYMKDADHRIRFANRAFFDFVGMAESAVIGAKAWDCLKPVDPVALENRDHAVLAAGRPLEFATTLTRADGAVRSFVMSKFPVHDAGGRVIGIGGINTDVTELRRHEEQLRAAKEDAERSARLFEAAARKATVADRAKTDFLTSMSHEIRTPLNGVMGMASLLMQTDLTAGQRDMVGTIGESGETLLALLNDILDLSKVEAGSLEIENRDFDLAALIAGVEKLWRPQAEAKKLQWKSSIDPSAVTRLRGDPGRLRQVIFNLVSNALKFTESGAIALRVDQTPREEDGTLETRFEVADTGPGIAVGDQARLFEKFTQLDSSVARRYGGTGLGLAICKSLVGLMGGEIGVDSAPGSGSAFRFSIVTGRAADEATAPASTGTTAGTAACGRSLRLLLAEDNSINRKIVGLLLEMAGHRFDTVENGREAVAAVAATRYDAVLMDIQMPELDGVAATREIRAMDGPAATVPIIALTANAMAGDRETYIGAGMNDYVSKPIDPAALHAALARQTDNGAAARAEPGPTARKIAGPARLRAVDAPANGEIDAIFAGIDTELDGR
mgnify:CR=1 FL=1